MLGQTTEVTEVVAADDGAANDEGRDTLERDTNVGQHFAMTTDCRLHADSKTGNDVRAMAGFGSLSNGLHGRVAVVRVPLSGKDEDKGNADADGTGEGKVPPCVGGFRAVQAPE